MAMTPGPDMEHDPQLAALYRAGTRAEPSAQLDDAIRAAARREVAAGLRRAGIRRWTVPVSLAAVVVLSVSVVTMMREQGADQLESTIPSPAETPAVTAQREVEEPPIAVAPEALSKRRSATPPPVQAPAESTTKAEVPAPTQTVPERAAGTEQRAAAADTESRAKAAAGEAARAGDSAARRDYAAPPPMADAASGAGGSAKPAAPAALSAEPARSELWQDLVREPPEKWRQRIAELRRAGKTTEADALTIEFHRRFPDERLPDGGR